MAPPTYTRTATALGAASTSYTINLGSPVEGELLVLSLAIRANTPDLSGLSGWTEHGSALVSVNRVVRGYVFSKVAGPSESNPTISGAQSSAEAAADVLRYPAGCTVDDVFAQSVGDAASWSLPLTPSGEASLIYIGHHRSVSAATWGSATSRRSVQFDTVSVRSHYQLADAEALSSGTYTATLTKSPGGTSTGAALVAIAIAPPPAASNPTAIISSPCVNAASAAVAAVAALTTTIASPALDAVSVAAAAVAPLPATVSSPCVDAASVGVGAVAPLPATAQSAVPDAGTVAAAQVQALAATITSPCPDAVTVGAGAIAALPATIVSPCPDAVSVVEATAAQGAIATIVSPCPDAVSVVAAAVLPLPATITSPVGNAITQAQAAVLPLVAVISSPCLDAVSVVAIGSASEAPPVYSRTAPARKFTAANTARKFSNNPPARRLYP